MFIEAKNIINNKAVTQSGQILGRVIDFEIDTLSQSIVKYHIQGDLIGFLKKPLIINADQVIEIKKNKLIVEDAVVFDIEYAK